MPEYPKLNGLVAATHTPFLPDGSVNLAVVEKQADYLWKSGVKTVFIGGTTGESSSLTLEERLALTERWINVTRGSDLKVIVHAGSNSLADARRLATQAQRLGASAVSALAPSYFKPGNLSTLVESMSVIAGGCPDLPFYYYEIPSMTGISISASEFLTASQEKIPNLAGIKFTSNNLIEYQLCLAANSQQFDIPFGFDEMLLAALALGANSAVGSSYNFAAPLSLKIISAFKKGDLVTARQLQLKSVELIRILGRHGYMAAAKATMGMLGVDVGAPRLPNAALTGPQIKQLEEELDAIQFRDLIK